MEGIGQENIKREFKIFDVQICIHLCKIHCFYGTKYKHTFYDIVELFCRFLQIFTGPMILNDKYILAFLSEMLSFACKPINLRNNFAR